MSKHLILGFDLDEIIVSLIRPWLHWYNTKFKDYVVIDDIRTYGIEKYTAKTNNIFEFFSEPSRYAACSIIKGASEGLKELYDAGHDIVITTAAIDGTEHIKRHLVEKAAPWLKTRNIMIGSRKELVEFDVFIDDSPKNITSYRKKWPESHILTMAYPYNKESKDIVNCYAENYHSTEAAWAAIVSYIHEMSNK